MQFKPTNFFVFYAVLFGMIFTQTVYSETKNRELITIVKGQTKLIRSPGVMRVSIGHPDIANAQSTGPEEILLTGLKSGVTDIRIWTNIGEQEHYLLKVVDRSWEQVFEVANIILANVSGVNVREENGIVFIEGRLLREQDIHILNSMKENLSKHISEGSVVFNVMSPSVSMQAMVMMDVKVVEVRRSDLKDMGVRWNSEDFRGPSYSVSGSFQNFLDFEKQSSNFGIVTHVVSALELLEEEGVARILAQPKLVTRSGSKAEFLAGGEIPIPIVDSDGALSVTFKQVGVILKMQPVTDPDGFIATKIEVEVSAVDQSVQVQDIPGFTTRRTKMEMNVQNGQTMVISGMLQSEDSKALTKVPGLSVIPILGELFKSRNFIDRTTELVVFVTPYLVDPESDRIKDSLKRSETLSLEVKEEVSSWSIFD